MSRFDDGKRVTLWVVESRPEPESPFLRRWIRTEEGWDDDIVWFPTEEELSAAALASNPALP